MKPSSSPETISVLYDDRGFKAEFGGVSRYYTELIRHLPDDVKCVLAIRRTRNQLLQAAPFRLPPLRKEYTGTDFDRVVLRGRHFPGINRFFRFLRWASPALVHADELSNERYAIRIARRRDIDLIHLTEPHFFRASWKVITRTKPFVVTVVDLIPELLWNLNGVRNLRKSVLDASTGIIAISQYTKDMIVNQYGVPESKIRVIHLGPDFHDLPPKRDFPAALPKQYILYVGRRREIADYKNYPFFVRAIAPLLRSSPDLFLLCTGKEFEEYDLALFRKEGIEQKVVHCRADGDLMHMLFAHARTFVYPSKMEGFGIPILDAFLASCPVILSNCSCFPEIAGDAALYFEDGDAEGLRHAVRTVMENLDARNALIARGRDRAKRFSWEKCASETADFYREVLLSTFAGAAKDRVPTP